MTPNQAYLEYLGVPYPFEATCFVLFERDLFTVYPLLLAADTEIALSYPRGFTPRVVCTQPVVLAVREEHIMVHIAGAFLYSFYGSGGMARDQLLLPIPESQSSSLRA